MNKTWWMFYFSYCKLLSAVTKEMLSFPSADKATEILAQMDFNDSKCEESALCGDVLNLGGKSDIFLGSDEGHKT